jgi:hypothetical protein
MQKMPSEVLNEIRRFMAEADALDAAIEAIESPAQGREAREIVRALPRGDGATLPDLTMRRAIAWITGEPFDETVQGELGWDGNPWEAACYEACLLAWNAWADGEVDDAARRLQAMRRDQASQESADGRTGAIHLLSLYFWLGALDRLAHGDRDEAQRLWRRAMGVGSQYGTESVPLIRWTFAASFFPPT